MSCTANISIHINLIKQHVHSHKYFQKTNMCTHILVYASTSTCWFCVSVHFCNWHSSNTHAHPFNYSSQQIGTPIYTNTHILIIICLGAHLYFWLNTHFCHPGGVFWFFFFFYLSQKVAMIWNFWKVAINFYDSVNPLWVSSRFSRSKHNELWSRRHCIKSVTVQFLWPVMLHQRRHLEAARCPRWVSTARNYFLCAVIYVATRAWLSLLCHVLHWKYPKKEDTFRLAHV